MRRTSGGDVVPERPRGRRRAAALAHALQRLDEARLGLRGPDGVQDLTVQPLAGAQLEGGKLGRRRGRPEQIGGFDELRWFEHDPTTGIRAESGGPRLLRGAGEVTGRRPGNF